MPQPSTTNHAPFTASPSFSRFASTSSTPLDPLVFANTTTRLFSDHRDTLDVRSSSSNLTNRLTSPQRNRSVSPPNRSTSNQVLDPIAFRHLPSKIFELEMRSMVESLGPKVTMVMTKAGHNLVEPLIPTLVTAHYYSIQASLQFYPHPFLYRDVKVHPSLTLFLRLFHIGHTSSFIHFSPVHNCTIFVGLPSLKNWKEKYMYVGYTEDVTLLGFTSSWSNHITHYTANPYRELDGHVDLLCTGGPFDHRSYYDPCYLHQLSQRDTPLGGHESCGTSQACHGNIQGVTPRWSRHVRTWRRSSRCFAMIAKRNANSVVFQDWVRTPGGRATMTSIAEVWLRDTDEDRAHIVREGEDA
nr:hypothetical protein Iba_chr10aCG13780 [Ipomoea batatas]